MRRDWMGLPVTTDSDEALTSLNLFTRSLLSYSQEVTAILAAVEQDPDCALAHAYAALFHASAETREGLKVGRQHIAKARALAPKVSERERLVIKAIGAYCDGDPAGAIAIHELMAELYPADIASAKIGQVHCFDRGDPPGILRLGLLVAQANDHIPYLHGMLAFGYEECHLIAEASAAARRACAMERSEPWAHHALAHVAEARGTVADGAAFMESVSDTWEGLTSFMHTHNWWHLCLFYLDLDRHEDIFAVYDEHIWGRNKTFVQDQIGAVSLLARLEVVGIDVGDRWSELADYIALHAFDHISPFLDLQFLYALGRAGRPEAETMVESIRTHAAEAAGHEAIRWREVGLPAAEGILAYLQGDYVTAARHLTQPQPWLLEIGGSHAQRDLFELLLLSALMRGESLKRAQQLLETRRASRPETPWIRRALVPVYQGLGLSALADSAAAAEPAQESRAGAA